MNPTRPTAPFRFPILLACAAAPVLAQVTVPLTAAGAAADQSANSALSRPDPAANASAALNNGGNPAAAIGAAVAARGGWTNRAPLIAGNAGTVGVNGESGSAAAASSANGVDTVGTAPAESIGMRRARWNAQTSITVATDPSTAPALAGETSSARGFVTHTLAAEPIPGRVRSATFDRRDAVTAQVQQHLEAKAQALDTAAVRADEVGGVAKSQFKSATREVRTAERRLRKTLRVAQRATAHEWPAMRDALAADYEIFALAVASAQRAAERAPTRQPAE